MSSFNCTKKNFLISSPKKASSSSGLDRFRDALKNGTRRGVSLKKALAELNDTKIKKKSRHYIWYVFPQPKPNKLTLDQFKAAGIVLSADTKKYFITNLETEEWLLDSYLRNALFKSLNGLYYGNSITARFKNFTHLSNYLGDDVVKFSSFIDHFKKIMEKSQKIKDLLALKNKTLESKKSNPKTPEGKIITIYFIINYFSKIIQDALEG